MSTPPNFTKPDETRETGFKLTAEEREKLWSIVYHAISVGSQSINPSREAREAVDKIEAAINEGWQTC